VLARASAPPAARLDELGMRDRHADVDSFSARIHGRGHA
jgi:hypothetical protein